MQVAYVSESPVRAAAWSGRLAAYLTILAVGSSARVFGLASQLVVLVMLGRILSKDSFGDLMTAFGFYRLAAAALGVGTSLVLLYHIARRPDDRAAEVLLHRYSAVLSAAVAAIIALAGFVLAGPIAHGLHKPDLRGLVPATRALRDFLHIAHDLDGRTRRTLSHIGIDYSRRSCSQCDTDCPIAGRGLASSAGHICCPCNDAFSAHSMVVVGAPLVGSLGRRLATMEPLGLELLRQVRRRDLVRQSVGGR